MRLANFTLDQLKVLPLRAIVAFAARCARRVEPLALLPEGDPRRESRREAVEAALRMAEAFARGTDAPPDESVVAAIDASQSDEGGPAASAAVSRRRPGGPRGGVRLALGFLRRGGGGRQGSTGRGPEVSRRRPTRYGRPRRHERLHGRRGRVRLRRLPQRGLCRRCPERLRQTAPPQPRPLSGAGGPGRPVPQRAAGPPLTGGRPRRQPPDRLDRGHRPDHAPVRDPDAREGPGGRQEIGTPKRRLDRRLRPRLRLLPESVAGRRNQATVARRPRPDVDRSPPLRARDGDAGRSTLDGSK